MKWFRPRKRLDLCNDPGGEVQSNKHRFFTNGLNNMIDGSGGKERRILVNIANRRARKAFSDLPQTAICCPHRLKTS